MREQREQMPEAGADRVSARELRNRVQALSEPVDPESLCFGRIDRADGRCLYLGRGQVRDESNQLLVINWRVPAAAPFYTATRNDSQGIALRRRFQLDQLRLLGIVDESFEAVGPPPRQAHTEPGKPAVADANGKEPPEPTYEPPVEPTPPEPEIVDAILAEMDRARGTTMRDIVATIEARQYELISDSLEGVLVIQGGPGTGKTAIALHRAAWLLYNHREQLGRTGVLVVGPNRAFMEYVAQVLPALGEASVAQTTVDRLSDAPDIRVRAPEATRVAQLKGDLRMSDVVRDAVRARVRIPDEQLDVVVDRVRVRLEPEAVGDLVTHAWEGAETYLAARERFRRTLVGAVGQRIPERRGIFRSGPSTSEVEAAVTGPGGIADRIWPTVTAPEVLRDLLSSQQRLRSSAPFLSDEERAALYRERMRFLRDESWTSADMPLLDEADVAIRGVQRTFGYVIADEAQDLTPMQLRMVLRRSGAGRATLVGDIAQSTGPWRFADWEELVDSSGNEAPGRVAELGIGYRVPRQVIELASELLPRIAPDLLVPRAVRQGSEEPRLTQVAEDSLLAALVEEVKRRVEGDRKVGLVLPDQLLPVANAVLSESGLQVGEILNDGLTRQVTLLSASQAKGLEFDHVVVVDPAAIAGEAEDWALVYVALSRATQTLSVLYTTEQPFERPAPVAPSPAPAAPSAPAAEAEEPEPGVEPEAPGPVATPATPEPVLGARYTEALMQAKFVHLKHVRRGTNVPYLAHLQAVASLVLEDGGGEDEAIAALLHDAVEDYGADMLDRIADQFGPTVARIVAGCTDPDGQDGMSWREVKAEHLRGLGLAGPEVRRVALAEKLENARALLRDFRRFGDRLWDRMNVDRDDLLWYVTELADLFTTERPGDMAFELRDTVERLLDLASTPEEPQPADGGVASPAAMSR